MTDTTGIEYTTTFDQRPTHPARPDALEEARENMIAAWAEQVKVCDGYAEGTFDHDAMDAATGRALASEAAYYKAYREWSLERDPDECTCTPFIDGLCPVCLAEYDKRQKQTDALMAGMDERHEAAHVMTEEGLP